jgi:hypothetical protein
MANKVFLGGTCNNSTWRDRLIPMLEIDYFNPVVEDWTPECQQEEIRQKNEICDIHLYVITPKMKGVFSIAEVIESAMTGEKKCVFCILGVDGNEEFDKAQIKSLEAVGSMVERHGGIWVKHFDDLPQIINEIQ